MYQVRPLGQEDVDAFRRVRLQALRLHPEAFGSAYEDEVQLDRAQFAERLAAARFTRFGGFAGDDLVGMAGLQVRAGAKERHKGHLFSMYVDAAHRRSGLSEQLVKAVISGARDAGVVLVHLSVTSSNTNAKRFYRRMGFTVYGVERRSLKVGDRFNDEDLMVLHLDSFREPMSEGDADAVK
jgi:ribosomal protein S18 acetylase RimI-like enzyme